MAVNQIRDPRRTTRRFYIAIATFFTLAVLIGFSQTYYLKALFDSPPVPSTLVHLHGIVMAAWVALLITQVYLISSKRIRVHQRLGLLGIALAAIVVIVGLMTAIAGAQRGATVPGIPPLSFLIVPVGDVLVFAVLFAAAVYYRKNPANHKRLILLTVLNFLPPAVGRFPVCCTEQLGPLWFYGVPDVLAIVFVIADTWRHKKLNKVFLAGALFMIASHPLRLIFGGTETWLSFAAWLVS